MGRQIGEQLAGRSILRLPVAKGTKLVDGDIVALNAEGYAVQASKAADLVAAGAAQEHADNTAGENGDCYVRVQRGVFVLKNEGDIKETDLLKPCYFAGPDSVTLTADGSSVAGKVFAVEGDVVAVDLF